MFRLFFEIDTVEKIQKSENVHCFLLQLYPIMLLLITCTQIYFLRRQLQMNFNM